MNNTHPKPNKTQPILLSLTIILAITLLSTTGYLIEKNTTNSPQTFDHQIIENMSFNDTCKIIGHLNPDTDTVASAIIASDLYKKAFNIDCTPAVSGKINNETKFVLQTFNFETPEILLTTKDHQIILVDHSMLDQSIEGMSEAEIMAIYDHHNLGNLQTKSPLLARISPLGSTATLLYTEYLENNLEIPQEIAGLMLSAILSDTNNLTSSTTTSVDKEAASALQKLAKIDDLNSYFSKMQEAVASYDDMSDLEILKSDLKKYNMSGTDVAVASVNAKNAESANDLKQRMQKIIEIEYPNLGVKHIYVAINNQSDDKTIILNYGEGSDQIMLEAFGSLEATLTPIASRKKDIIPPLESAYNH